MTKSPIPTPEQENIEQALSVVWVQFEKGEQRREDVARAVEQDAAPGLLEELIRRAAVFVKEGKVEFSDIGRRQAQSVVRRNRLAERMLQDVLILNPEDVTSNACRLEHVLTSDVEEAICTLLGHPEACPHGQRIPRGACCQRAATRVGPILVPLSDLSAGQTGTIAYLSPGDRPELHRFLSLGLVPGTVIRVSQTAPAFVISHGGTMLAMDASLARHIFVRINNARGGSGL